MGRYLEERIVHLKRFQGQILDFRSQLAFLRYDECEFVKCTILIDEETECLAFTHCSFEDCNISELNSHDDQGLVADGNVFKLPIEIRKIELHARLIEALANNARHTLTV